MKAIKSMLAAVTVLGLAACSSKDYYDADLIASNKMAAQKTQYETNFETAFGQVASNQSWDFSTCEPRLGTRAGEEQEITTELVAGLDFAIKKETVARNSNVLTDREITKNKALIQTMNRLLPDGKKHTGEKVVLLAPSSDFTIYPLSIQGLWKHDLFVKVGNNDPVLVYSKDWTTYGRPTVNGDVTELGQNWEGYYAKKRALLQGVHIKAPIGTRVDIYLDNINGQENNMAGTTNGQAIYINCDAKPEGVTLLDGAVIKYIGIEDNKESNSDKDFNDVVLAVVGNPDVPEVIDFTDESYDVPLSITKRYMIEDLGSTDDFDFNDIVVDVTETTIDHHKVTLANDKVISDEVVSTTKTQKAVIRHLGGTLPFQLTIGDTQLDEMQGVLGSDPDAEFTVTGWIPAQNNVSISVKAKDSEMYTVVNFPKTGAIPMIFACNDDVEWAAERVKFNFGQFSGYNSNH